MSDMQYVSIYIRDQLCPVELHNLDTSRIIHISYTIACPNLVKIK